MVVPCRGLLLTLLVLCCAANIISKIVLPHKLRYLENMLNSEVIAKAAKIRQKLQENPNAQDGIEKNWPMLLAKYQDEKKPKSYAYNSNNIFGRRGSGFK